MGKFKIMHCLFRSFAVVIVNSIGNVEFIYRYFIKVGSDVKVCFDNCCNGT